MGIESGRPAPALVGFEATNDIDEVAAGDASEPRRQRPFVTTTELGQAADGVDAGLLEHVIDRQNLDILTSFGDGGRQPGQFYGVHSIATDSRGNIFTTETFEGKRLQKFVYKGIGNVPRGHQGVVWPSN